jgi:hypothetical protein
MKEDSQEYFAAVGRALSTWSVVEQHLTTMFHALAGIRDMAKSLAIFDTIISLETRLDVIDALMELENLSPLELETWNRCSARITKLHKKRHELAHFTLVAIASNNNVEKIRLSPFHSFRRIVTQTTTYLDLGQLKEREEKFYELAQTVPWFFSEIQKNRGLLPSNPMQETALLGQLRVLAAQILEERARKQKSSRP